MSITSSVHMALKKAGKRQKDLAEYFGKTPVNMSLKMRNDSWFGRDLARVAAFTGGRLAFVYPDGQIIYIEVEETKPKKEEAPDAPGQGEGE